MKVSEEQQGTKCTFSQVLAAVSVSLGSLLMGFTLCYTLSALETFYVEDIEKVEWVGDILHLLAVPGSIAGGILIEYIGRKKTILLTAIPFFISWLLLRYAYEFITFQIGRGISGFCNGLLSVALPIYLGEAIQPKVRGILGLLPSVFANFGIILYSSASIYTNSSVVAFIGAGISIALLAFMFLIPETPRWYLSHKYTDRAHKALVWLKGKSDDVEPEVQDIIRLHSDIDIHDRNNIFLELIQESSWKPLLISLGLMFFQQLSGINTIMYYSFEFLETGPSIAWQFKSILIGLIACTATICAGILIDRFGRKVLLYISNIAMFTGLFIIGGIFYSSNNGTDITRLGWLPISSFYIFIVGFGLGLGPIPWLMMGEILPVKIRGPAAGIVASFNWTCAYLVTKYFFKLFEETAKHSVFWFHGSICIIGIFFVRFFVPETKGKTLEDIEYQITGRKRSMPSAERIYPDLLKA